MDGPDDAIRAIMSNMDMESELPEDCLMDALQIIFKEQCATEKGEQIWPTVARMFIAHSLLIAVAWVEGGRKGPKPTSSLVSVLRQLKECIPRFDYRICESVADQSLTGGQNSFQA